MRDTIKQIFQDDEGHISCARVISIWGYIILTILLAVELIFDKSVSGSGQLYIWLIGASAGGKAAGKFLEKKPKI